MCVFMIVCCQERVCCAEESRNLGINYVILREFFSLVELGKLADQIAEIIIWTRIVPNFWEIVDSHKGWVGGYCYEDSRNKEASCCSSWTRRVETVIGSDLEKACQLIAALVYVCMRRMQKEALARLLMIGSSGYFVFTQVSKWPPDFQSGLHFHHEKFEDWVVI